jgi:hypothetical protein
MRIKTQYFFEFTSKLVTIKKLSHSNPYP